MTDAAARGAAPASPRPDGNPFLGPILARWHQTPDAVFGVFYDGDTETWQPVSLDTFMRRALQFTALLRQSGIGAADVVEIVLEHGLDPHAAFIGTMLCGAVPSFLPHPNSKQSDEAYWHHHRSIFAHTRPRAILVYDALAEAVTHAAAGTGAIIVSLASVAAHAPAEPGALADADATALLQHSSGTTGLKKGVALSYRAICLQLEAYAEALDLGRVGEPRIASWLPLYHDMGLITSFLLPVRFGIPIIAMDPFEWVARPTLLFDAIEAHRASHAWLPNFAFMHMARTARRGRTWDLGSLVALISCSEPCKSEAFDTFSQRFAASHVGSATLQTCYAMAETVFAITQSVVGQPVRRLELDRSSIEARGSVQPPASPDRCVSLLSNGRPVPGCSVEVLRDGQFVGEREIGELCVTAPFLFSGYYHNPQATQAAFHGSWYRTGDLGFVDAGEVFIVGRLKDVIIVNGKNIFAHDVEAAVSRIAGVKPGRAVAFGWYSAAMGSEQLVVVAERAADEVDAAEVARAINQAVINEVGIPAGDVRIVAQAWLVKTTSGKISRADNARKYGEELPATAGR